MNNWSTRHTLGFPATGATLIKFFLGLALSVLLTSAVAQQNIQGNPTKSKDSGWYPESVHWSPRNTDLLVTACSKDKEKEAACTLFRYLLAENRWASLSRISADFIYKDAVYSPNAQHIAAVETGKNCSECPHGIGSRLVLLDAEGARVQYLTPHGFRIKPTFSKDGKKMLYWSLGLSTAGRTMIGLFDVWELDIGQDAERRMTHFFASEIESPPRYWPDGVKIMLAAGDYARTPNVADFRSKDGKDIYAYHSVFRRNGTVVTEPNGEVVRPYFYPMEGTWLLALDISPDGQTVIYDDHTRCMKSKSILSRSAPGVCIAKPPNLTVVASYAPDSQRIASIWGNPNSPAYWRLGVVEISTQQITFIDLSW